MEEIKELIKNYGLEEDLEHVIIPFTDRNGRKQRSYLLKRRFIRIVYPGGQFIDYPLEDAVRATIKYPELLLSEALYLMNNEANSMNIEAGNKTLVNRFYAEVLNLKNLEVMDSLFAQDAIDHDGEQIIKGIQAVKDNIKDFLDAFPDIKVSIEHLIAEGEFIVSQSSWAATHTGSFSGMPASGRHISNTGLDLFRVSNGKIVELWSYRDVFGLLQQIGARIGMPEE